ncbi:MAG TPA: protein-disulfide reductase DsbD [Gammaproteobacteria bacterium]|nr:protein-disulfide reductase DsbD [Gammaproteobacteria bacterium]
MAKIVFSIFLSILFSLVYAKEIQPLPPEQAFVFSTYLKQNNELIVQWQIAPGYYLYRNQLNFTLAPTSQVKLGKIILPEGKRKSDSLHGNYQAYVGTLRVTLPLIHKGVLNLGIAYQGCSMQGFCYSPINKNLEINLVKLRAPQDVSRYLIVTDAAFVPLSSEEKTENIFAGRSVWMIALTFLGIGLLLAFTPCVLPMLPILSAIIVDHSKRQSPYKSFSLSLAYVVGMAVTYAIAGVIVALLGRHIQTEFQRPWVIIVLSALFILLAFSLFGLYELQLPARWRTRLTHLSHPLKGGNYFSVFLMGSLSSLIVSPCVSAPLVGVLAYIAQTGNIVLGASALLALGIGIGIPLLLIGASAGKILPKAGSWMQAVEKLFGILMLGVAISLLSRILSGAATLFLWGILLVFSSIIMGLFSRIVRDWQRLRRAFELLIFTYGIILMTGAFFGNTNPFHPWEGWQMNSSKNIASQLTFITPTSMQQLDQELKIAKKEKKPVILDFYADWCVSCVTMERTVFSKPDVQRALSSFVLLRMDITKNNDFDRNVLKRFHVIAPPTILFFDDAGNELTSERIIGETNAAEFLTHIKNREE